MKGKEINISFTWCDGDRVYPDSIDKWNDGSALTDKDKERVFNDVLHFVKRKKGELIVVINTDDPFKNIWEHICSINQPIIDNIEYTSDEENYQFLRNNNLDYIKNGGGLIIDETVIKNEQDLDEAMQKFRVKRDK